MVAVLACGVLFAAALNGFAYAAPDDIADHIVINEVEIGHAENNDWVELYNPTQDAVTVGGWTLSSFLQGSESFTIDAGDTIAPGQYMVYELDANWFSHHSSIVQLKADGALVDYTTLISDLDMDSRTWSRVVDGRDTVSADDWALANSTRGASNTEETVDENKWISVQTDLESYTFGETVRINGTVKEILPNPAEPSVPSALLLEIVGSEKSQTVTLYPDRQKQFRYDLILYDALGFTEGQYAVNAVYSDHRAHDNFSLSHAADAEDGETKAKFLSVSSDTSKYNLGQTVAISGSTNAYLEHAALSYEILEPDGDLYKSGNLFPSDNGTFQTKFQILSIGTEFGEYRAQFEYAGMSAKMTFEVENVTVSESPVEIFFDKKAYNVNDTVQITGIIHDVTVPAVDILIQQVSFTPDSVTRNLDKVAASVRTVDGFGFSYNYTVYENPDRFGKYKITFSTKNHHEVRFVVVTKNPEEYVANTAHLTVGTDRAKYNVGDPITFTGLVNTKKGDVEREQVRITITDPDKTTLTTAAAKTGSDKVTKTVEYALTAVPDGGGQYSAGGTLFRSLFTAGIFEATATYAGNLYTANTTFEVVDPIAMGDPFVLHVAKNTFGANEQVTVTAEAPGLATGSSVKVVLHAPSGTTMEFDILSDDSSFDWSWKTPSALGPENQGTYNAVFTNRLGAHGIEFTVGSAPVQNPVTVTVNANPRAGTVTTVSGSVVPDDSAGEFVTVRVYPDSDEAQILYESRANIDETNSFKSVLPLPSLLWAAGPYTASVHYGDLDVSAAFEITDDDGGNATRHTAKFVNLRETEIDIPIGAINDGGDDAYPRILQGSLVAGPYGTGSAAGIRVLNPSGTCVVGSDDSCLVSSVTKITADGPYRRVAADGVEYNVRYGGSDAEIEKFTILPVAKGQVFDESEWTVVISDEGLPTKFHYKITYVH